MHTYVASYIVLLVTIIYLTFTLFILQFALRVAGIVVTASVANYWLSIVVFIMFVLIVLFQRYFLCTSRSIQRLEALGSRHNI